MNKRSVNSYLDALNRIDELACITAESNLKEAKQLEKDYNKIFDLINSLLTPTNGKK